MYQPGYPKRMIHSRTSAVVSAADEQQESQFAVQGYVETPLQQYREYPKTLRHPDARLVAQRANSEAYGASERPEVWEPANLAPVIARNSTEEKAYRKLGFEPAGSGDAIAFSTAVAAPVQKAADFQEYPKYVNGPNCSVLVRSPSEEDAIRTRLETAA